MGRGEVEVEAANRFGSFLHVDNQSWFLALHNSEPFTEFLPALVERQCRQDRVEDRGDRSNGKRNIVSAACQCSCIEEEQLIAQGKNEI